MDRTGPRIGVLRASITKLADLTPVASLHAQRHEDLARRLVDRGHRVTAGVHWFAAAQLWLLAAYPMWDTTDELIDLHRRKTGAFRRWADTLVAGYDLREPIAATSSPWKVLGGEADELCDKSWVYEMADRCGAPASSLLYEGATHALDGSPAPAVGPFFRTEIADWLADRVDPAAAPAASVHERVTRDGRVVAARQSTHRPQVRSTR